MSRVTIQDIADALGISRNTVSKVLNQSDGIAQATRDKVLQKAIEMGYKQLSYVSMLTKVGGNVPKLSIPKSSGVVALITTTPFANNGHFGVLMLDHIKKELSQLGFSLEIHFIDKGGLSDCTLPNTFIKEQVSAIICIEMLDRAYGEMICSLNLPVLFVDGPANLTGNPLPADQLYMENSNGITQIVRDMIAKGKQKIGFIGDYRHCQSFYERYTAFRMAMLMENVPVYEEFCITSQIQSERETQLNTLAQMPDLFLCANDFVAAEAINILRNRGISIPQDVLFAGFDDAPESRIITPQLTTIHIHSQSMAYNAVQLLVSRIAEPSLDYRVIYTETSLIYRDSTKILDK